MPSNPFTQWAGPQMENFQPVAPVLHATVKMAFFLILDYENFRTLCQLTF